MRLLTALVLMIAIPFQVQALPASNEVTQVCWTAPTEDANNNPIGTRALSYYAYFWDKATGVPTNTQRVISNGVTCFQLTEIALTDITLEIGVTAFFNDSPTSKETAFSNIIELTNTAGVWTFIDGDGVPKSPTNVQAQ